MTIIAIGLDLTKNVFAVHGVDETGKAALVRPSVKRDALLELVAKQPPCVIGMEACSGAHHWAREFHRFGHTVRLMAPKFVIPYRLSGKRGKNDAADAAAICEAVTRPNMRFVPIKSVEQQAVLVVHRVRKELVELRNGQINQARSLLAEFGVVIAVGRYRFRQQIGAALDDPRVPELARQVLHEVNARIRALDEDILAYDRRISAQVRDSAAMQRIVAVCGVGPVTASAVVASVGDATLFRHGRLVGPARRPANVARRGVPGPAARRTLKNRLGARSAPPRRGGCADRRAPRRRAKALDQKVDHRRHPGQPMAPRLHDRVHWDRLHVVAVGQHGHERAVAQRAARALARYTPTEMLPGPAVGLLLTQAVQMIEHAISR